ncbi:meiosis inhibitor protein 1-like [Saccoglossus kowalevskii]
MSESANFTAQHSRHDKKWFLSKDNTSICIGCLVEILEDSNVTLIKKKYALSEFLSICRSKTAEVYNVLHADDPATAHCLSLLHGTIWYGERRLAALAVEAIVHICSHLKCQDLVSHLLTCLITKILQTKPCGTVVAGLSLLSHLCQSLPAIVHPLLINQDEILHYLLSGLHSEDVEIQSSIMYTLSSVYSDVDNISSQLHKPLCHNILVVLESTQSQQLITNTVGLLKKLLANQSLAESFMNYHGDVSLPSVLKKILLQCSAVSIKIAAVQCLCQLLVQNDQYAALFLQADIAEFLYETLATTDHLLIGSVLCCLLLLSNSEDFYSKCHSVYGMEAIIRSIQHCLQSNRLKVAAEGFQMLAEILDKQPENIPVFSNVTLLPQVLVLITSALQQHNKTVALSVSSTLIAVLRPHHMGNTVDLELLEKTLKCCLLEIKHYINTSQQTAVKESFLRCLVQLMEKAIKLKILWQETSSVKFNSDTGLMMFAEFVLNLCDESCVPVILANYDKVRCGDIFACLFSILSKLNQIQLEQAVSKFYSKLGKCLESSVNSFLLLLCGKLLNDQSVPDIENIIPILQITLPTLTGNVEDLLRYLEQDSIGITSEQIVSLSLLYIAYLHGDRLVDKDSLVDALETFIRNHADISSLPLYAIKFVLFLFAGSYDVTQVESSTEGCALLIQGLNRVSEISAVFTHHSDVLCWCYSTPIIPLHLTKRLTELWLNTIQSKDGADFSLVKELLSSNPTCLQVLLELLTDCVNDTVEIIVSLLQDFLSMKTIEVETFSLLNSRLTDVLQRMILQSKPKTGHIKLLLPLLIKMYHQCDQQLLPADVSNIKLIYHVCKLFNADNDIETEVHFHSLNYLNFILIQATKQSDSPVISMILSNRYIIRLIEGWSKLESLPSYQCTSLTTIALLIKLVHQYKSQVEQMVSLCLEHLIKLVSGQHPTLVQACALHVWIAMLSVGCKSNIIHLYRSTCRSQLADRDVRLPIPTKQLQQLYILLQNIIIQNNELLQSRGVDCLYHLLKYTSDIDTDFSK